MWPFEAYLEHCFRKSKSKSILTLPNLTLAAALVAGVERADLAVFNEKYLFHGTAKRPNGDPDQFEAIQFSA
jgi:hypothetical protein